MRNHDEDQRQRGIAAVELAVMLPLLVAMLFLIVEGASAFHAKMQLVETSREVARLVLRDGDSANVAGLVDSLTQTAETTGTAVDVTLDPDAQLITVEVHHEYHSPFADGSFLVALAGGPVMLDARTVMPMP